MEGPVSIRLCQCPRDYALARELFEEYEQDLGFSLCFQGFATELETLDSMYSSAVGGIWLAEWQGDLAGCVGLRAYSDTTGEVKRMYVRPNARGHGIARRLMQALEDQAVALGYQDLILDSLPQMKPAIQLYQSLGFAFVQEQDPQEPHLLMTKTLGPRSRSSSG